MRWSSGRSNIGDEQAREGGKGQRCQKGHSFGTDVGVECFILTNREDRVFLAVDRDQGRPLLVQHTFVFADHKVSVLSARASFDTILDALTYLCEGARIAPRRS